MPPPAPQQDSQNSSSAFIVIVVIIIAAFSSRVFISASLVVWTVLLLAAVFPTSVLKTKDQQHFGAALLSDQAAAKGIVGNGVDVSVSEQTVFFFFVFF